MMVILTFKEIVSNNQNVKENTACSVPIKCAVNENIVSETNEGNGAFCRTLKQSSGLINGRGASRLRNKY